jgi:cobalt transporter subunit CbtB
MNSDTTVPNAGIPRPAARRDTIAAALAAALLGVALLYLSGFAPMEALHHGAHDMRHAAALPCH